MQNYSVEMLLIKQLLLLSLQILSSHIMLNYPFRLRSFLVAEEIGCFSDQSPDRKTGLIFSYRGKVPWKDLWKVVRDCSREAKKNK